MKTSDELKLLKVKEEISNAIRDFERKVGKSVTLTHLELYSDTKSDSMTIRAVLEVTTQ